MTIRPDLIDFNIKKHLDAMNRLRSSDELKNTMIRAADEIAGAFASGGKLILCGNGGSAADCQHIAAEFVGRFRLERRALPAIALHCNTSSLTAIGNDYGFDSVFSRQIEAFANEKDVVIGISTSGSSANVVGALEKAKEIGCVTVMLTGEACRKAIADLTIKVPSDDTPTIQEMHIFIGHFLAEYVEMKIKEDREADD